MENIIFENKLIKCLQQQILSLLLTTTIVYRLGLKYLKFPENAFQESKISKKKSFNFDVNFADEEGESRLKIVYLSLS